MHRGVVLKLLRNLKIAKRNQGLDEMRWMNPEVLILEVPSHLAPKIQSKMNKLFQYPSAVFLGDRNAGSRSLNYSQNMTASTPKSNYSRLSRKKKKVKVKNLKHSKLFFKLLSQNLN